MKKLTALAVAFVLLTSGVVLAITESQATVAPVLQDLKLKPVPSDVIGGPQTYKITDETIKFFVQAKKTGKVIVLKPNGSIEVVQGK